MMVDVSSNGKKITSVHVKEPQKKRKEKIIIEEPKPESLHEQRDLTIQVSRTEGVLKSSKTGITSNFTIPFALALGFTPTFITFLVSTPQLIGALSQLLVEKLTETTKNRKRLMVTASYLESYTWLAVLFIAAFAIQNPYILIILVVLDAIFINIQSPIWNSIMSDTVPNRSLSKYFSTRNLFTGISGFSSMLLAGIILSQLTPLKPLVGFAIIFGFSFLTANIASRYQQKMIDPTPQNYKSKPYSMTQFITNIKDSNFGVFTAFFSTYKLVVYIASPFFAIYMLQVLKLDYLTFTIITVASTLSSLLSIRLWGKLTDKYGAKRVFSTTAILIAFIPLPWILTKNWILLAGVEAFSGIVWAGFNLSTSVFIFESVKSEQKIKFYAYNNVLVGAGVFLGTMIGSLLINIPPVLFATNILFIFLISGILRFVTALAFIPRIQEERVVSINFGSGNFFKNFITLRPKEGAVFEVRSFKNKTQNKNQKKDKTTATPTKNVKVQQKGNKGTGKSVDNTKPRIRNTPLRPIQK